MASSGLKQVNTSSKRTVSLSFTLFGWLVVVPDAAASSDQCSSYAAQSQRIDRPFYKGLLFVDWKVSCFERPRSEWPNGLEGLGLGSVHEGRHRDRIACSGFERCRYNLTCVRPPPTPPPEKNLSTRLIASQPIAFQSTTTSRCTRRVFRRANPAERETNSRRPREEPLRILPPQLC